MSLVVNLISPRQTWSGGSDSYLEYLIKYARLTNNADPLWSKTWALAIDSSIKYLVKTSSAGNHLYLTATRFNHTIHQSSHLACFHGLFALSSSRMCMVGNGILHSGSGGNWILGGKLLDNQTMVDLGLKLTDACVNTYTSTAYYLSFRGCASRSECCLIELALVRSPGAS